MAAAKEILDTYQSSLHFSDKIKQDAWDLFNQYSNGQECPLSDESIHLVLRLSILAANCSSNSEKHPITVPMLLSTTPSLKAGTFFQTLRHFLGYVKLPMSAYMELKGLVSYFALLFTIFKKFDTVLTLFGLTGANSCKLKEVGWLLYVIAKNEICEKRKDIVELACLLIPLLNFLLYRQPMAFDKVKAEDTSEEIKKRLYELFQIKSESVLEPIFNSFHSVLTRTFEGLLDMQKAPTEPWDEAKLDDLIKHLSKLAKPSAEQSIDETVFVKEPVEFDNSSSSAESIVNVRVTPIKFHPDKHKPSPIKSIFSPGKCDVTLNTKLQEASLEGFNIPCRTIFNEFTPVATTISMNNWLQNCLDRPKLSEDSLSSTLSRLLHDAPAIKEFIRDLLEVCSQRVSDFIDSDSKLRCLSLQKIPIAGQIRLLYFCITEELLMAQEKKGKNSSLENIVKNKEFHKGTLVASCETILFIHELMNLQFESLLEIVEVSAFDFWKVLPAFLRFDQFLPFPIVQHFQELEKKILSYLAWQRNSPISGLFSEFFKQTRNEKSENLEGAIDKVDKGKLALATAHKIFIKKVLQLIASSIMEITQEMKLTDNTIKERIWETMKYCLSVETSLLLNRHLVHLILCSIYAVCKAEEMKGKPAKQEYKFNSIIQCYLRTNGDVGSLMNNIFHLVKVEEKECINIIEFYNKWYLPRMQTPVQKICSGMIPELYQKQQSEIVKGLAPNSPLKEALPRKCSMHGYVSKSTVTPLTPSKALSPKPILTPKQQPITPKLTPRTQALFVCAESPMLKPKYEGRPGEMRDFLKSKILDQQPPVPTSSSRKIVFEENDRVPPTMAIRHPVAMLGLPKFRNEISAFGERKTEDSRKTEEINKATTQSSG